MNIVVTGGRDYKDWNKVYTVLDALNPDTLYVGDCPTGVDAYTKNWHESQRSVRMIFKKFDADWDTFDRAAGPIRNKAMLDAADDLEGITLVIAFPGNRGTENTVTQAKKLGMIVLRVE